MRVAWLLCLLGLGCAAEKSIEDRFDWLRNCTMTVWGSHLQLEQSTLSGFKLGHAMCRLHLETCDALVSARYHYTRSKIKTQNFDRTALMNGYKNIIRRDREDEMEECMEDALEVVSPMEVIYHHKEVSYKEMKQPDAHAVCHVHVTGCRETDVIIMSEFLNRLKSDTQTDWRRLFELSQINALAHSYLVSREILSFVNS